MPGVPMVEGGWVVKGYLDAPLFEVEKASQAVSVPQTPFFHNDGGRPTYVAALPKGALLIEPAPTDPALAAGREHRIADPGCCAAARCTSRPICRR